jgi:hypothetical protein
MYDVKQRIKFLIILINSGKSHRLSDKKIKKWELELESICCKYENNPKYSDLIKEVRENGVERINKRYI